MSVAVTRPAPAALRTTAPVHGSAEAASGSGANNSGSLTGPPRYDAGVMVALDHLPKMLIDEFEAAFPDRCLLGAWLYGSRARGEERADSDIDVAVLYDSPLDPVALFDASSRLAARLGAAVDIVDLRRAGGLLRVEATHRGRAILPLTHEAELFTTHALADHAAFAPNRRAATAAMQEKFHAR